MRKLFQWLAAPEPMQLPQDEARVALAVLMVRLARSDGDYALAEIARIDRVLAAVFGLDAPGAAALRTEAEMLEREAPDTVRFTRAIKAAVRLEDRIGLVEALWSVALADGGRDAEEDRLMRLVVSLLGVTDPESGLARQRAARLLG
ncbi:Uncharacterized conserved protein, tellurite resistance protein B (TerB) family [Gemmobacter megaterium]|uniref:Uncharacterized conserved protein, tellurite resistance protein B (TerB) family n=1 Tax=Gemmobacter megaterium TaxID=1086013 RepID=A0A1N7LU07_9RHOB|nr:TerB family tellurite resistance protein [Gemmobacter megaterium]GGE10612.1 hypothetical protein GCM10011345_15640 [Gemmobacter megaterium]SIS77338.1 Uncharacterized conserved protein, tellurite resistance protein B (TerB) family [Gemmobacter megaterium]